MKDGRMYIGDALTLTTVPALLTARAEANPDDRFVGFGDESVSYGQMRARAEQAAASLATAGVGRGDRVAIMLPNCLEFLDIWFGAALLGAVFVPVNMGLKGDGLRYVVEHCEPQVIVVDESVVATLRAALPEGATPAFCFVRGTAFPGWASLSHFLAGSYAAPRLPAVSSDEPASVLYTSGTTGPPKGVLNCHNAYATAAYEFTQRCVRVRGDDVLYTSLPLFHVNAQMLTTCGSLVSGRPMVLAPRFSASGFLEDLRRTGATVFNYIGAMLTMIAKQPEQTADADNRVRLAVGGAAPEALWPAFEKRFGLRLLEIYGLTETATFCLGSPPDDIRVGKLGLPTSWSEVRVLRSDGTEAADGEPGEIVIRSKRPDVLFHGYFKNSAATQAAMTLGWFHSGDRGRRDPDGYFVYLDRLKDSIRRRGENISSYEVEQIVNAHPSVAECAAIGVPSPLGEEDVLIVAVPKPGADHLDPAQLVAFCGERMAPFMVPRYVRYVDQLPKTATERVQKYVLRGVGTAGSWDREALNTDIA
ncbi:ATP-dependent acyl-CoA ligase [Amycolatopsis sp. NPDC051061]|uniref:ATP-dependent acyl-CoA ligase n=1 Tax=Amycolatopsis sp. NPDC051061 TaxID=3155042 RepID=UPI003423B2F3